MVNAALWQHVVAIAASGLALGWLVRRAVKGGGKATGPCASCPASRGRGSALAKRHFVPERVDLRSGRKT